MSTRVGEGLNLYSSESRRKHKTKLVSEVGQPEETR